MALVEGVAGGWMSRGPPVRMRAAAGHVGVSQDAVFALQVDGRLVRWGEALDSDITSRPGVAAARSGSRAWRTTAHMATGGSLPRPTS